MTSQHIASFSASDLPQRSHSTLHMPHSSPQFHTTTFHITSPTFSVHLALRNIPHTRTPHSAPHIPHHTDFAAFQSHWFHITPCLKWQHCTSIAPHCTSTIIHIKSLHHISAHHSTSRLHSTSHSNVDCPSHINTFQTTPHIPHCTSTTLPHQTNVSNLASNHSTSLGIPQPHPFHILHHRTPPYSPCTTPSFHIASPHFTTSDIAQHHV